MIHVIETLEAFDALRSRWIALETSGTAFSVFQTYTWCRAAWDELLSKHPGNILWILQWTVADEREAILFPFYIDRRGTLRWIMDVYSDSCDAVYCGEVNRTLCYQAVIDTIREEKRIRSVFLRKTRGNSSVINGLGALLSQSVLYRDTASSALYLSQSADCIAAMTHLRAKHRKVLHQQYQQTLVYEYRVCTVLKGDIFPESELLALREVIVQQARRKEDFFSQELLQFTRRLYDAGACEIALLLQDKSPQALSIQLLCGKRSVAWFFFGRTPKMTSLLDTRYMVEKAKTGEVIFDFGTGLYDYKMSNFRPQTEITFSLRMAKSFFGRSCLLLVTVLRFIKQLFV